MNVAIIDAVRTPRGRARADGALAGETPHGLVAHLARGIAARGGDLGQVEGLTLGCVGQVGAQGGHLAVVAKLAIGLPETATAHTLNNYCAAGLSAIGQAAAAIAAGQANTLLAGGVEMMSRVPFMSDAADYYTAHDLGPTQRYIPVALAADALASTWGIGSEALDAATLASQTRAAAAENIPALQASRLPLAGLTREENLRLLPAERLAALLPAFGALAEEYSVALAGARAEPRLTVAHAPPMADGAGLALLTRADVAPAARARIVGYAESGGDARLSLTAGFAAMDKVLARTRLTLGDIDRIEFMEAFAVVIARFLRDYPVDPERVNVSGGHLAKGHPMGATGAILLSALLDTLDACDGRYGLVVVTGASGVGAAMIVERPL